MSSASDPLDQAFPDASTPDAAVTGDPLDAAFPEKKDAAPDSPWAKRKTLIDKNGEVQSGPLGFINGLAELGGKSIANIPYGAAHAVVDLTRRIRGTDPNAPDSGVVDALKVPLSGNAKSVATSLGAGADSYIPDSLPGDAGSGDVNEAADFGSGPTVRLMKNVAPIAADAAAIAPVVALGRGISGIPSDIRAASVRPGPVGDVPSAAQDVINQASAGQSMGAAGAATDVASLDPQMQTAIVKAAQKTGGAVNLDALKAHAEASEHGVQLMRGQATRDPEQFTEEQNSTHPDIVGRINAQETQMVDALDTIRRDASPTNVANSPRENGQVVINDLKAYDTPKVEAINAAYKDANDANVAAGKGTLKLDPKAGVDHAAQTLEDREDLLPSEGQNILTKMKAAADAGVGIPVKQAETWKTIVSRASRKYERSADNNAVNALSDFRDSLEAMNPTSDAAAGVQEKFNTARSLAKQRFDEMDADPAYKAAALSTPEEAKDLSDTFLDDNILGKAAAKSQVDRMMSKLSDEGQGAVASHALGAIRKGAVSANGKISPSGFNTAMQKYGDKLGSLVSPETQDSLESLGRVVTNSKVEPAGGKVNYSRSGVIARDAMKSLAEGAVDKATRGVYGYAKNALNLSENKFAREALKPGAGLEDLKEKP